MGETYCNAYDQFRYVLNTGMESYFEEIKKICETESVAKEFYEVCKSITDIGLNSNKSKNEEGIIQGYFFETDINIAKSNVIKFIKVHEIKDIEGFLRVVEDIYDNAVEWDDKRAKTGKTANVIKSNIGNHIKISSLSFLNNYHQIYGKK